MDIQTGDILYATLVIGTTIVGYRVVRSVTMSLLTKVVLSGIGLALMLDFHAKYGWKWDTAQTWLWKIVSPDRTFFAGILIGLALVLRDRYTPMLSEAGFLVQRMKKEAEADLARQRREIEVDIARQHRKNVFRETEDVRAEKERIEQDIHEARERLKRERARAEKEHDHIMFGDPYEVLGISRNATSAEIKKRYRELVAQYHPDKAAQTTPEISKLAEERVKEINWAYEQIR